MTRFLRSFVLITDPGFEGTFRDFVNQGEKLGLIDDARAWMGMRELRNITLYDYSEDDLTHFLIRLKNETPRLISVRTNLMQGTKVLVLTTGVRCMQLTIML